MTIRLRYADAAPDAYQAMLALEAATAAMGLECPLLELVKVRASLLNGCAYCVDMHTKDARAGGETEQRLYAVAVWREAPFFSPRERAALAWTDAVTTLGQGGVPTAVYEEARTQFSEAELVRLTVVIVTINGWNRLVAAFGADVGSHQAAPR